MAGCLSVVHCLGGAELRLRTAKLVVEDFRVLASPRSRAAAFYRFALSRSYPRARLQPFLTQSAHAAASQSALEERCRAVPETRSSGRFDGIFCRHEHIFEHDVVAAAGPQSGGLPGILDLPLASRQAHSAHRRNAFGRTWNRFPVLGQHADCCDPVCVLTPARKRPSSIHPEFTGLCDGCSAGWPNRAKRRSGPFR